jgi:hypothetical protein
MTDLAAAALPQGTTKLSPFFVERGYEPRMSFDWQDSNALSPEARDARKWAKRLQEIWKTAQQQATRAQEGQKRQADRHRREVDFTIGDQVFITTRNWQLGRPSRKLADLASGPFEIVEKVGHAYRLKLPENLKVHPIFNPSKLRLASKTSPLTGQLQDPPPPELIEESQEWEVEKVLASRLHYRKLQYRVKWIGYDEDWTWYPASNLKNAPQKLIDYHEAYPGQPGPPRRLPHWTKAALEDEYLEDHEDDDKAATASRG